MTTSEKAIIQHEAQQGFFQKLKNATWEDMLIMPLATPLMLMINNMFQQWQTGTLSFEDLAFGSGLIMFLVLFALLPLFCLKLYRLNKQDEKNRQIAKEQYERDQKLADDKEIKEMRRERHSLEMKRRRTDINVAEIRTATELQTHKMITERRLELLTASAKELDARTTLKTAIAFTIFNKQSKEALSAISELETSEAVKDKIKALEDQIESLGIQSLEDAEKATKNYQEALAGGLPIEVDYEANGIDCPAPPAAEVTLEGAPKFDEEEKVFEEEIELVKDDKTIKFRITNDELIVKTQEEKEEEEIKPLP